MGLVHAEIEIMNGYDIALARNGIITKEEIKHITTTFLVDNKMAMLCINDKIQERLQLSVSDKRKVQAADGIIIDCDIVEYVELRFKDRGTTCRALVLPGNSEPLLGFIPLQGMDVIIHLQRQELIVNPNPRLVRVRYNSQRQL